MYEKGANRKRDEKQLIFDVLPGLKPRDSRLLHGKRAQFSSPTNR